MNARPALSTGGSQRGYLIPIGGAEEKEIHPVILRLYVELCGGITVVDPSDLEYSSIAEIRKGEVVSLLNVRLHILAAGARFDTITRKPFVLAELEPEEVA